MSVSLTKPSDSLVTRCAHCRTPVNHGRACLACTFPGYGTPPQVSASACSSVICRGLSRHVGTETCSAPQIGYGVTTPPVSRYRSSMVQEFGNGDAGSADQHVDSCGICLRGDLH